MAGHVFHEIFLHFNWHTKNSLPLLNQSLESPVREYLQNRCRNTKGVYFHAVHGTPTHVHLAINIEPFVTISDLVRDLKGGCSPMTSIKRGATKFFNGSVVLEW